MAKIADATKTPVLTQIELKEYADQVRFTRSVENGSVELRVTIATGKDETDDDKTEYAHTTFTFDKEQAATLAHLFTGANLDWAWNVKQTLNKALPTDNDNNVARF